MAVALALGSTVSASASSEVIELQDDCDAATFNLPPPAGVGPGTCVGSGGTTFSDFIAELKADKVVGAWEFSPPSATLNRGDTLIARNTGGETHSFTKVTAFGGGIVPILNQLSGLTTPAVIAPGGNQFATFIPAGSSLPISGGAVGSLTPGKNMFECLIHPWMQAVVTVE